MNVVQVFYEHLQMDPITQLRRVMRAVGVRPDEGVPAVLRHNSNSTKFHSEDIKEQVGAKQFKEFTKYFKKHAPCFLRQLHSTKPEVFWPPC